MLLFSFNVVVFVLSPCPWRDLGDLWEQVLKIVCMQLKNIIYISQYFTLLHCFTVLNGSIKLM